MTLLLLLDDSGPPDPFAANWPPFLTERPGVHQGRLETENFDPTQGDFAFALGSDQPKRTGFFKVGDHFDIYQSETPANVAAKLVSFRGALRGPSSMPVQSSLETFNVTDGQTIELSVDRGATQIITLDDAEFTSGAATSIELVPHINAQLVGAKASLNGDGSFSIWSDDTGRDSGVRVIGGTATAALGLEELVWKAQLLIDGTVIASVDIDVGIDKALDDMAANILDAFASAPFELRFRLEVGTK